MTTYYEIMKIIKKSEVLNIYTCVYVEKEGQKLKFYVDAKHKKER